MREYTYAARFRLLGRTCQCIHVRAMMTSSIVVMQLNTDPCCCKLIGGGLPKLWVRLRCLLCVCNNTLLRTTIVYVVNYKIFWLHNNCFTVLQATAAHHAVSSKRELWHPSTCWFRPYIALYSFVAPAGGASFSSTRARVVSWPHSGHMHEMRHCLQVLTAAEYTFTVGRLVTDAAAVGMSG